MNSGTGSSLVFPRGEDGRSIVPTLADADAAEVIRRLQDLACAPRPADSCSRIPRIFHQIWLGSPLPSDLRRARETWARLHPSWEMKLWTDADVEKFDFPSRDLFESSTCYGQRSDLLRAEVLLRFGGVYVDLDYRCLAPIDETLVGRDFVTTAKEIPLAYLGWPGLWPSPIVACNSFIAAIPNHPLLADYLRRAREVWDNPDRIQLRVNELPPVNLSVIGGFDRAARLKETSVRTYLPFHESVLEGARRGRDMVLSPCLLNPRVPGWWILYFLPEFWKRTRAQGRRLVDLRPLGRIDPKSLAVHCSKARWLRARD